MADKLLCSTISRFHRRTLEPAVLATKARLTTSAVVCACVRACVRSCVYVNEYKCGEGIIVQLACAKKEAAAEWQAHATHAHATHTPAHARTHTHKHTCLCAQEAHTVTKPLIICCNRQHILTQPPTRQNAMNCLYTRPAADPRIHLQSQPVHTYILIPSAYVPYHPTCDCTQVACSAYGEPSYTPQSECVLVSVIQNKRRRLITTF